MENSDSVKGYENSQLIPYYKLQMWRFNQSRVVVRKDIKSVTKVRCGMVYLFIATSDNC